MALMASSHWRLLLGILACAVLSFFYARGGLAYLIGFVVLVPWLLTLVQTHDHGSAF